MKIGKITKITYSRKTTYILIFIDTFSERSRYEDSIEGSLNAMWQVDLTQSRFVHFAKMGWSKTFARHCIIRFMNILRCVKSNENCLVSHRKRRD